MTLDLPRSTKTPVGMTLTHPVREEWKPILSHGALEFAADLARRFEPERQRLLRRRKLVQAQIDAGRSPNFLAETAGIRDADWRVAPIPADLMDRRVEITGPVERKMVINALNSDANVFMADFEDSNSPTWKNVVEGQINLADAVRGTIEYTAPDTGKHYALAENPATLIVRPRGWHLVEAHVEVDGEPISAALFDFALFFFHNARELLACGTAPYFYLPKLESHLEARLWNEVFLHAQEALGIPRGTIRATVLIETILAAFEMDEILYELREHSSGLNCGRWDYIFSFIKKFRTRPDFVLPDRFRVTMEAHFLESYSLALIQTCHRRGAHAMGGMAAQIPIKRDAELNRAALAKVEADKRREAANGHDGTWIAHPGLVAVAKGVFDELMPAPNQLERLREDVTIEASDLLQVPKGPITEAGLNQNVSIGLRYLAAWLGGSGCVPIDDLMEDAATAEISRAQLWQWIHHGARLEDGRTVDAALFRSTLQRSITRLRENLGDTAWLASRFPLAATIFEQLVCATEFEDFLTLPAYAQLTSLGD